jgi:hypothetical protein
MNKIILFLVMFLLIPLVSGIPVYTQDDPVDIRHPIRVGGGADPNVIANVTVTDPRNQIIFAGEMTFDVDNEEHSITLPSSNTSRLGVYDYCISSRIDGLNGTGCFQFEITLIGQRATTSQSIVFGFIGFMSLIFFLLALFGSIKIPFKNSRNERGFVVGINDLKYIKLLLWFVTYLLLISLTFSFAHVSQISNWDVGYRIMNGTFAFLIAFLLPTFTLMFTFAIIMFFSDRKKYDMISRNLRVR